MEYEKQTWVCGETITAEKLLHMEEGIEQAGAPELPTVTSDDNGDVLTVVDGAWDKATPSGGGGGGDVLVVKVINDNNSNWVCDKTAQEILDALNSGTVIQFPHYQAVPSQSGMSLKCIGMFHYGQKSQSSTQYGTSYTFKLFCMEGSGDTINTYAFTSFADGYPTYEDID